MFKCKTFYGWNIIFIAYVGSIRNRVATLIFIYEIIPETEFVQALTRNLELSWLPELSA